jgi:hypothetical protein
MWLQVCWHVWKGKLTLVHQLSTVEDLLCAEHRTRGCRCNEDTDGEEIIMRVCLFQGFRNQHRHIECIREMGERVQGSNSSAGSEGWVEDSAWPQEK